MEFDASCFEAFDKMCALWAKSKTERQGWSLTISLSRGPCLRSCCQHGGDGLGLNGFQRQGTDRTSSSLRRMMDIGSRFCLLVAGVTLVAGSASAQPTPAAPLDSVQDETTLGAPAQNLSEKLNQSNGVIHPKEVDPAIEKPAPNAGDPNVVPPPGTSGGAPAMPK